MYTVSKCPQGFKDTEGGTEVEGEESSGIFTSCQPHRVQPEDERSEGSQDSVSREVNGSGLAGLDFLSAQVVHNSCVLGHCVCDFVPYNCVPYNC